MSTVEETRIGLRTHIDDLQRVQADLLRQMAVTVEQLRDTDKKLQTLQFGASEEQLQVIHTLVLARMAKLAARIEETRKNRDSASFWEAYGAKQAFIEIRHLLERSFPHIKWVPYGG